MILLKTFALSISSSQFEKCGSAVQKCPRNIEYRSTDGSCNNLEHPNWGSSGSEYGRILKAKYSDGESLSD